MTSEHDSTSMTLEEAFNLGVEHYQKGEKASSREIFEKILAVAPDSLPVLQVLSVLDMEEQEFAAAEAKLRHAQSLAPQDLSLILDLAIAIKAQGRNKEALGFIEEVLSYDPANTSALQLRQELTALMGQRGASKRDQYSLEAIQSQKQQQLDTEIQKTLDTVDTLIAQGHHQQAEQLILAILSLDENNSATLHKWAQLLISQEKNIEASHQLRRLVELDPSDELATFLLAKVLARLSNYNESRLVCQQFVRDNGPNALIEKQWLVTCVKEELWLQSDELGKSLVARYPEDNDIRYLFAFAKMQLLRERHNYTPESMQETLNVLEKALAGASKKRHIELTGYKGEVCWYMGDLTQSRQYFSDILQLNPDSKYTHWVQHHAFLHQHEWDKYYDAFELGIEQNARVSHNQDTPRWHTNASSEEVVLVLPEQGVGDEIRYYHSLGYISERAKKVFAACDQRLVPFLSNAYPDIEFVPVVRKQEGHTLDIPMHIADQATSWIPAGSIGREIYLTTGKHWAKPHYAVFPQDVKQKWQQQVDQHHTGKGLRIGISWRSGLGSAARNINFLKTHEVAHFIKQFPDATFYNLQYGECSKELKKIEKLSGKKVIQLDELDLKDDFLATAAVMDSLDLVFTAPTAVHMLTVSTTTPCYVYGAGSNESNFAEPTEYFGDMHEKQEFLFRFPPLMGNKYPMIEAISDRIKNDFREA
ncbi:hypothetical protein A3K86_06995 [Photobacterium jeanii]|uniref:Tetratricopeptide repeat protein n=1 Tax=Photobacterium jeanii TaxID=858640 RepID=A0A178KNX6_9GAMM|nr:tetratricopeptide repeat protein [Photobacterium jeanii]OAN18625.1 hypothetical protein A3K86_06995 [Photobacterium jeanii]PST91695.1 hypothetical protein C9I91_00475 [Photobacterium jeanii]